MRSFLGALSLCLFAFTIHAQVWYVNWTNTTGPHTGESWATAFTTVQEGIDAAESAGGEVWVAAGTYDEARTSFPHGGSEGNTGSILMKHDIDVYGGFMGFETQRNQRNPEAHETILDGSTARDGSPAYHVVVGVSRSTLDGFTITGGVARGTTSTSPSGHGGGYFAMYGGTASRCIFRGNAANGNGGGMYVLYAGTATNCTFAGNSAQSGGGIYEGWVTNCVFTSNTADAYGGGMAGGMAMDCVFTGNSARSGGGKSSGTATNCTFTGNSAASGGGMNGGTATNCIIWGNWSRQVTSTTVTFSLLSIAVNGEGNLTGTPHFVAPWTGDFRLRSGSPGVDAGTVAGAPITDILGRTRPQGGGVDMGAYEHVAGDDAYAVDPVPELRVDAASTATAPDGLTWATAFPTLQAAADRAGFGTDLWVVRGVYTSEGENVVMLRPETALYGGFAGVETERDQRSMDNSLTIIDGQGSRRGIQAVGICHADGMTILNGSAVHGGGMQGGTASNCAFANNSASGYGGGTYGGTFTNCTFTGNSAKYGGGNSYGTATNCTFTGNSATDYGGGMYKGISTNCIIWGNGPDEIYTTTVTFSLLSIEVSGNRNLTGTPDFINPWAGDYRLRSGSPGIDAGTKAGAPKTDALGRTRPQGRGVDMGAYEHGGEDDLDAVDAVSALRVDAASTATEPDGLTWATAFPTLQAAADHAGFGTELWVARGVYTSERENVVMLRPETTLYGGFAGEETERDQRSRDNSLTIIDGQGIRRGIQPVLTCIVDGVTITNGSAVIGGGMKGGTAANCAFTNNSASEDGGAMYGGMALDCVFTDNSATKYGGAMYGGTAFNCAFSGNSAAEYGGAMYDGTATDCTFTDNASSLHGGGMYNGKAQNCTFTENSASYGGGTRYAVATNCTFIRNSADLGAGMYAGWATNCIFTGNSAAWDGGGMHSGHAINCVFTGNSALRLGGGMWKHTATKCTFTNNTASSGGAIYLSDDYLDTTDCIFWNNSSSLDGEGLVAHSLIEGGWPGEGNIDADPLFVVPPDPGPDGLWGTSDDLGDLRLQPGSPCIDAGGPDSTPSVDLAGTLRPQGAKIDMGAYEYVGDSTVLLTLTVEGSGTVAGIPAGVHPVIPGTSITLKAVPAAGRRFVLWQGSISGRGNPAYLVMAEDKAVKAVFTRDGAEGEVPILRVAPDAKRVSANSARAAVHVYNAGGGLMPWTAAVTSGGEFLSIVSGASGMSNGTLLLAFTENATGVERYGHVTITAEDVVGSPAEVVLTQTAEPAPTPTPGGFTADMDGDNAISLSELLRVVMFYNAGGLHCAAAPELTEDGYVSGPGTDQTCGPHASDYRPTGPDWSIDLLELLRVIQFFNGGGYRYCPEEATEDGFCPAGL
jgi:predicted outer membrane repeat protein